MSAYEPFGGALEGAAATAGLDGTDLVGAGLVGAVFLTPMVPVLGTGLVAEVGFGAVFGVTDDAPGLAPGLAETEPSGRAGRGS